MDLYQISIYGSVQFSGLEWAQGFGTWFGTYQTYRETYHGLWGKLGWPRGPRQRFLKPRKWSAGGVEGRQTPRRGRNFGDAHILGALESIQPDIQDPSSTISEVVICIFSCRPGTEPTWRLVKARPMPLEMEEGICDLLLLSAALTLACRQLDSSCMAQRARLFHKSSPELLAARILTVSHQNQPSNSSHTRHMMAETGPICQL